MKKGYEFRMDPAVIIKIYPIGSSSSFDPIDMRGKMLVQKSKWAKWVELCFEDYNNWDNLSAKIREALMSLPFTGPDSNLES